MAAAKGEDLTIQSKRSLLPDQSTNEHKITVDIEEKPKVYATFTCWSLWNTGPCCRVFADHSPFFCCRACARARVQRPEEVQVVRPRAPVLERARDLALRLPAGHLQGLQGDRILRFRRCASFVFALHRSPTVHGACSSGFLVRCLTFSFSVTAQTAASSCTIAATTRAAGRWRRSSRQNRYVNTVRNLCLFFFSFSGNDSHCAVGCAGGKAQGSGVGRGRLSHPRRRRECFSI